MALTDFCCVNSHRIRGIKDYPLRAQDLDQGSRGHLQCQSYDLEDELGATRDATHQLEQRIVAP